VSSPTPTSTATSCRTAARRSAQVVTAGAVRRALASPRLPVGHLRPRGSPSGFRSAAARVGRRKWRAIAGSGVVLSATAANAAMWLARMNLVEAAVQRTDLAPTRETDRRGRGRKGLAGARSSPGDAA
jgi:hypothetical protein